MKIKAHPIRSSHGRDPFHLDLHPIDPSNLRKDNIKMQITFTGHAGFFLETKKAAVAIDPWFTASNDDKPLIEGLLPPFKTVDFQLFPFDLDISKYDPDAILVSHFHTHHSPREDIKTLIGQSSAKKVKLGTPAIGPEHRKKIEKGLGKLKDRIEFKSANAEGNISFTIGDMKITGLNQLYDHHMIWIVQSPTGTFAHVADARICRDPLKRDIAPFWRELKKFKIDFFAVSPATHHTCYEKNGKRWIEQTTLSPPEAAALVAMYEPQFAAPMGIYNHSQWTRELEFPLPAHVVEDQFHWAVRFLSPKTECLILRPGDTFELS